MDNLLEAINELIKKEWILSKELLAKRIQEILQDQNIII